MTKILLFGFQVTIQISNSKKYILPLCTAINDITISLGHHLKIGNRIFYTFTERKENLE